MTVTATGHQAISTKYLGPTDHRCSRVTAKANAGRVSVPWDHDLDVNGNHEAACAALVAKLGWPGDWRGGGTADGYVFVCIARDVA